MLLFSTMRGRRPTLAVCCAAVLTACSQDALRPDGGTVETIIVTPRTATVSIGANLSLVADLRDADGTLITRRVNWSSEDPSIAEISAEGVVTGRRTGTVRVAASAQGKDALAQITVNPTPVASVRISASHRSMLIGQTAQLTAEALDAGGAVLAGRPIAWSTSNASVATVSANGLVSAMAAGGAIVTASSEGESAVASVTVSAVPVASVVVTPGTNDLLAAQTAQLTAQVRDASGATLTGRAVIWATSAASIATVTSQGLVTAIAPGTATITATSEGKTGSAAVTVSPRPVSAVIVSPVQVAIFAGQSTQLTTLVTDDRGQVLTGRPISYVSGNVQVATVSQTGVVSGISPGSATITVTSGGAADTAIVTVMPEPVATVDVSPGAPSIIAGTIVQLTATARNANGQPLSGRAVSWASSSPGTASVSSSGIVTGLVPGGAIIVATIDGKQGSAVVTVRPPVATVTVAPLTATINPGQTVTLTATLRDASGNVLTGRVVSWASSNVALATVSANGVVTGVAGGAATITATSEAKTGSATVTVTGPGPVATVTVSPSTRTINVGATTPLTATARDANGTVVPGAAITWSTSNAAVATVSSGGVVTGVSVGTATITATSNGKTGTATITVQLVPVDRIVVTPANPSVKVGNTVQLTATLYDAQNNVLTGRTVTWTSSNTSRATVNNAGLVLGVSSGTATITASSGGKSGSTVVTVTN